MPHLLSRALMMTPRPETLDLESRTVEVVFSTGAPVQRYDDELACLYLEALSLDPAHVDLTRLNSGAASVLNNHSWYAGVDAVVGVVEAAWVENGEGLARLRFSKVPSVQDTWDKVAEGVLRSVSVGYSVRRYEVIPSENPTQPETRLVTDWEPFEISLVAIPADPEAVVRGAHLSLKPETGVAAPSNGEVIMDPEQTPAAGAMPETAVNPTPEAARLEERRRCLDIRTATRALQLDEAVADELIHAGVPLDQARARLIDKKAEASRSAPVVQPRAEVGVDHERSPEAREAMAEALSARALRNTSGLSERARQYMGLSLLDVAADVAGYRGKVHAGTADEVMTRAFHTTSDFPAILENTARKVLMQRYTAAQPTYQRLAVRRDMVDFKTSNLVRVSDFPTLTDLNEAGELTAGTVAESKEQMKLKTFGRQLRLTREMLINDDLSAFDQVIGSVGSVVARFENNKFFALLLSASGAGPTLLQDNTAMFHANHGNLAGSGAAIDVTSLGVARAALRKQKGISNEPLNTTGRILLVGPDKETQAEQVTSPLQPQQVGNVNPFAGRLEVLADANITGNAWYVFAAPDDLPNFAYGYLNGQQGPNVRIDEPFGVLGVSMAVWTDFAVAAMDYRGAYRNPGA